MRRTRRAMRTELPHDNVTVLHLRPQTSGEHATLTHRPDIGLRGMEQDVKAGCLSSNSPRESSRQPLCPPRLVIYQEVDAGYHLFEGRKQALPRPLLTHRWVGTSEGLSALCQIPEARRQPFPRPLAAHTFLDLSLPLVRLYYWLAHPPCIRLYYWLAHPPCCIERVVRRCPCGKSPARPASSPHLRVSVPPARGAAARRHSSDGRLHRSRSPLSSATRLRPPNPFPLF
eukprot:scaffold54313_cov34-Tisochrysis_lutea.AAC.4